MLYPLANQILRRDGVWTNSLIQTSKTLSINKEDSYLEIIQTVQIVQIVVPEFLHSKPCSKIAWTIKITSPNNAIEVKIANFRTKVVQTPPLGNGLVSNVALMSLLQTLLTIAPRTLRDAWPQTRWEIVLDSMLRQITRLTWFALPLPSSWPWLLCQFSHYSIWLWCEICLEW